MPVTNGPVNVNPRVGEFLKTTEGTALSRIDLALKTYHEGNSSYGELMKGLTPLTPKQLAIKQLLAKATFHQDQLNEREIALIKNYQDNILPKKQVARGTKAIEEIGSKLDIGKSLAAALEEDFKTVDFSNTVKSMPGHPLEQEYEKRYTNEKYNVGNLKKAIETYSANNDYQSLFKLANSYNLDKKFEDLFSNKDYVYKGMTVPDRLYGTIGNNAQKLILEEAREARGRVLLEGKDPSELLDLTQGKQSKALTSFGEDLLSFQPGNPFYGTYSREAMSGLNPKEELSQSSKYLADQVAISTLKAIQAKNIMKNKRNLIAMQIHNIKNPDLKVNTEDQEKAIDQLVDTYTKLDKKLGGNYLKTNYPEFYKKELSERADDALFNSLPFYSPTKNWMRVKSAAKGVANLAIEQWYGGQDLLSDPFGSSPEKRLYEAEQMFELKKHTWDSPGYMIGFDKTGSPVESTQAYWVDGEGKTHYNFSAMVESGIPIAAQMAETILATKGLGSTGALGSLGRVGLFAKSAKFINKLAPLLGEVVTADRLATFASVYASTYPTMYAQEYFNFKDPRDAKNIAALRAVVEGITESWVPNTPELLTRGVGKGASFARESAAVFEGKIRGMFPGLSNGAIRKLLDSKLGNKLLTSANNLVQEGIVEEELALLGNHFVDNYAKKINEDYIPQNDLTWDNFWRTGVEATISMLPTAGFMGSNRISKSAAEYSVANNPDLFKSYVKSDLEKGRITQEEALKRFSTIDHLSSELKSLPSRLSSIRSQNNLLEDKDAQFVFFNLFKRKQDIESLPQEQQEAYKKELEGINSELYKYGKRAEWYESLSTQDKRKIIHDSLKERLERLTKAEDVSPADLAGAIAHAKNDVAENPDTYTEELQQHIKDLEASKSRVRRNFVQFIIKNNKNLTQEQLLYKYALMLQNVGHFSEKTIGKYRNLLDNLLDEVEPKTADEFIEAAAKNLATDRALATVKEENGKHTIVPLRAEYAEKYFSDTFFDKFIPDNLSDEAKAKIKEDFKERLFKRVKELKEGTTPEQAFPQNPATTTETTTTVQELEDKDLSEELKEYKEAEEGDKPQLEKQLYKGIVDAETKDDFLKKLAGLFKVQGKPVSLLDEIIGQSPDDPEFLKHIPKYAQKKIGARYSSLWKETQESEEVKPKKTRGKKARTQIKKESPKVSFSSIQGQLVEYKGFKGHVTVTEGGVVAIETDNLIIEIPEATGESNVFDFQVNTEPSEEPIFEASTVESANYLISEDEIVIDGVKYTIRKSKTGNIVGLSPENKPKQIIRNEKLLVKAEIIRNREVYNQLPEGPKLESAVESVKSTEGVRVVRTVYELNFTDTVASAIDKLYRNGTPNKLTPEEKLQTELWVFDALDRMDDLLKQDPTNEYYKEAFENLLIINKLLHNERLEKNRTTKTSNKQSTKTKKTATAEQPSEIIPTESSVILEATAPLTEVQQEVEEVTNEEVEEEPTVPEEPIHEEQPQEEQLAQNFLEVQAEEPKEETGAAPRAKMVTVLEDNEESKDPSRILMSKIIDNLDVQGKNVNPSLTSYDLHVKVSKGSDLFREILPNYESLEKFVNGEKLSKEGFIELFRVNGELIVNQEWLDFVYENKDKILTATLAILTDKNGKPINFNKDGKPTKKGQLVVTSLQNADKLKASAPTIVPVIGISPGFKNKVQVKPNDELQLVLGEEPVSIERTHPDGSKTKILQLPGATYLHQENKFNPITPVYFPKTGDLAETIFDLVEAYTEGTAPEAIMALSPKKFYEYILTYAYAPKGVHNIFSIETFRVGDNKDIPIRVYFAKTVGGKTKAIDLPKTKDPKVYEQNKKLIISYLRETHKNIRLSYWETNELFHPISKDKSGNLTTLPPKKYKAYVQSKDFGLTYVSRQNRDLLLGEPEEPAKPISPKVGSATAAFNSMFGGPQAETPPAKPQKKSKPSVKSTLDDLTNDELYQSKDADIRATAEQNQKAKLWVENHEVFKNTPFVFYSTILHPEAYGVWSPAGVRLFQGANYTVGYHEAWHEFTQMYLTPEQREDLYKQARKIYGNLTDLQLEERLADDFRQYAMSEGKVLPQSIRANKEAKNIFQKIYEFLKAFVSQKQTVDKYFSHLYRGQLSNYRRSPENLQFQELNSSKKITLKLPIDGRIKSKELTFRETDRLVNSMDSLFAHAAEVVFKRAKASSSYLNAFSSPARLKDIYREIESYLNKRLEVLPEHEKEKIQDILSNFETVVNFHLRNSYLFDNKVRSQSLSSMEDEDLPEQKSTFDFDKSINEISSKELASLLVINMVRVLPKWNYETNSPVMDPVTNLPIFGEFDKNWSILQKHLQGSRDFNNLLSKLEALVKEYPQFTPILERLPRKIELNSDSNIRVQFFKAFATPYIDSLIYHYLPERKEGKIIKRVLRGFKAQTLDITNLRKEWGVDFFLTPGDFKSYDSQVQSYYLNLESLFTAFPEAPKDLNDIIRFAKGIGINYSDKTLSHIEKKFNEPKVQIEIKSSVVEIYNKLKDLAKNKSLLHDPLEVLSKTHSTKTKSSENKNVTKGQKYASANRSLTSLLQMEVDANPAYADDMIYNAEGKQVWTINQHTYESKLIQALNDSEKYPTLKSLYKDFPQFDPAKNKFIEGSAWLDYLFDENGERIKESEGYRQLSLLTLNGIKVDDEGEKLINSTDAKKHLTDVLSMLDPNLRTEEQTRFGDKADTRGFQMGSKHFLFNSENFTETVGNELKPRVKGEVLQIILNYLKNEVDVVGVDSRSVYFNKNKKTQGVPNLGIFTRMFSSEEHQDIFDSLSGKVDDIAQKLKEDGLYEKVNHKIFTYFADRVKSSKRVLSPLLKEEQELWGVDGNIDLKLFQYHIVSFIFRTEQFKLFFHHPYYYKSPKDVEKRLSAWAAFGDYPQINKEAEKHLKNSNQNEDMFRAYAKEVGIPTNPRTSKFNQISYLVFEDVPVNSETVKENEKDYGKHAKHYLNNSEASVQDAAAFSSIDFFKKFYSMSQGWDVNQEKEYQRQTQIFAELLEIKKNEKHPKDKLLELLNQIPTFKFSIKKLQYAGVGDLGESIPVFHKYSVKFILPSEIAYDVLNGKDQLFDVLSKLYASSADYGVFKSGTKISETIKETPLYRDGKVDSSKQPTGVVDLKYLKEQQIVENKEDPETIFASQFRKLSFKDMDSKEEDELFKTYKEQIKRLVEYDKKRFFEKMKDPKRLVRFLINELIRKDATESTKDLIRLNENGELEYSIDSLVDRTMGESAVVSALKRNVIRQKFNGGQLVQYPVSIIRPDRKLKFYRKENGVIQRAQTIVSFSPKYYALLSLPYDDNSSIGEVVNGVVKNPYDALRRLNEKLTDELFRKEHSLALTLLATRIPTQGYNSMEHFEVVEFLPEESGDIILVPDEIVVKSGSDFDIDKLFTYQPYLSNGELLTIPKVVKYESQKLEHIAYLQDLAKRIKEAFGEIKDMEEIIKDAEREIDEANEVLNEIEVPEGEFNEATYELITQMRASKNITDEEAEKFIEYNYRVINLQADIADETEDEMKALYQRFFTEVGKNLSENPEHHKGQLYNLLRSVRNEIVETQKSLGLIRQHYQNDIFNTLSKRLSQSQIFDDLVEPNSTDYLKAEAQRQTSNDFDKSPNYTNLVNPLYQLTVFQNNRYRKAVGIDAKNNTFQALAQQAGLTIVDKKANAQYVLPHNNHNGEILLDQILNVEGVKISGIISQILSGHVDLMREDSIVRININDKAAPVALYMTLAGTPLSDIVDLLSDPEVIKVTKGLPASELIQQWKEEEGPIPLENIVTSGRTGEVLVGATVDSVFESMANPPKIAIYLAMKAQSDKIFTLSQAVDYDTFSPQNFESFGKQKLELRELAKENFFNEEGLRKIVTDSILAPFEMSSEVGDLFSKMFPISANGKLTGWIIQKHGALKNKIDYDNFSRVFKNDFLTAIFETYYPEMLKEYEKYLRKGYKDSLPNQYESLKNRLKELNIEPSEIFNSVVFQSDPNATHVRPGLKTQDLSYSQDAYAEDFENALRWSHPRADEKLISDMQKFFLIFAHAGLISTQLNKNPLSYLPLIPPSIYTSKIDNAIQNTLPNLKDFLVNFQRAFKHNRPEFYNRNKKLVPNPSLTYFRNYDLNSTIDYPSTISSIDRTVTDSQMNNAVNEVTQEPEKSKTVRDAFKGMFGQKSETKKPNVNTPTPGEIDFQESTNKNYNVRTKINAAADATIAIAHDFNSLGEKATKKAVEEQGKEYIAVPIPYRPSDPQSLTEKVRANQKMINSIVDQLNDVSAQSLNIAGNGLYTLKNSGYSQEDLDELTYALIEALVNSPRLKTKITLIRTGGQTGIDEAGAKAGMKLGIPTIVLAPKGWKFRNESGQDVSDEKQFKERFKQPLKEEPNTPKLSISDKFNSMFTKGEEQKKKC